MEKTKKNIFTDIIALLLLTISILTILSIISFHKEDSIFFTNPPQKPIKNFVGIGGAYWSSLLLLGFGKASFIIGIIFLLIGWYILIKKNKISSLLNIIGLIILLLTISTLLNINVKTPDDLILIKKGGIIGFFLKEFLTQYTGTIGTYIISISLLLLSLILLTDFSIKNLISILLTIKETLLKIINFFKRIFNVEVKQIEGNEKPPLLDKIPINEKNEEIKPHAKKNTNNKGKHKPPKIIKTLPSKKLLPTKNYNRKIYDKRYSPPPINLLTLSPKTNIDLEKKYIYKKGEKLEETLKEFGIDAKIINIHKGPVITRYELQLASGIKVNKIVSLSDNIALSLAAQRVRIVAPIPGKAAVGVEIPNPKRKLVTLGDILSTKEFQKNYKLIEVPLGKDISGNIAKINIKDCPHLLIAGATGSGKSILLNSIICSLLYNFSPKMLKFIIIDPKMVELKIYTGIPHLITEVLTEPKHALIILKHLVKEMNERYKLFNRIGARDLDKYNERVQKIKNDETLKTLPYIIVIIDEFSDLMLSTSREIEELIVILAQKARAVGIHLIIATQRPSVDVITGIIKANFPTRIAFQVASKIDSRTILDEIGAEKLLGKGDMLVKFGNKPGLLRVQGAFISEEEVENIIEYIKQNNLKLDYLDINDLIQQLEQKASEHSTDEEYDEMYYRAKEIVRQTRKASASYLQRKLKIGFNRAARYIDMMEEEGIIGPQVGSKSREVYLDKF